MIQLLFIKNSRPFKVKFKAFLFFLYTLTFFDPVAIASEGEKAELLKEFPPELKLRILSFLPEEDLLATGCASKAYKSLADSFFSGPIIAESFEGLGGKESDVEIHVTDATSDLAVGWKKHITEPADTKHAWMWDIKKHEEVPLDIRELWSCATAISGNGHVISVDLKDHRNVMTAGRYIIPTQETQYFEALNLLVGEEESESYTTSINKDGNIVSGYSTINIHDPNLTDTITKSWIWREATNKRDLVPALVRSDYAEEETQVKRIIGKEDEEKTIIYAGHAAVSFGGYAIRAFWGRDDQVTMLPTLNDGKYSEAMAVNPDGIIAGWSSDGDEDNAERAVLWRDNGSILPLSIDTRLGNSYASDLSGRGDLVIGWIENHKNEPPSKSAFIYDLAVKKKEVILIQQLLAEKDLKIYDWTLEKALRIRSNGRTNIIIIGNGTFKDRPQPWCAVFRRDQSAGLGRQYISEKYKLRKDQQL